ncbi:lipase secretion chaperone [Psychrobacter sp. P11G5]|uniref:lipase secretion chaperone n=1 Tax=Psychrobacter sp. P11G5 TaxID=1699624 RepID=UPI00078E5420|nr:lipase secretion chaperone [Psychrobacter sp. P11G5]AMN66744.1 lipase chaperone [Psychrobacter sp. P11G5]
MSNKRRPYLTILVITVIIIVTAVIILWFKPNQSNMMPSQTLSTVDSDISSTMVKLSDNNNETALSTNNNDRFITGLENLPRSLQGTDVDGEIIIDENKQLVVTEGLRRLFDYFLSALGEEDEATIFARVESYIRSFVPEPAASQAIVIFNKYVAYLKAIPKIEKRFGNLQLQATQNGELDLNMVAQQKQDVAKLRQQYFDTQTITAFFGAEDEYDDYSIAMININQNKLMSDEQKAAAQQDYVSRMPDNMTKVNIEQQANLNALMSRTEQMKAQGATPEALYNMRRELVGAAAAGRLAQLDKEGANFDQRFTRYQVQKQQLLSQNTNSTQTRVQIEQLGQQLFSDTERKRLAGYAAMQQQQQ